MELKTDGTGGEVNFFRGTRHARGVHDSEKQFQLVDVHLASPDWYGGADADTCCAARQWHSFKPSLLRFRQNNSSDIATSGLNATL
jgi:hypothetical protein